MTRQYDRKIIKFYVFFLSVSESGEKFENDEKYTPHDPIKKMEQVKKSLNRLSKIVIFKKRNVRKCF